MGGKKAKVDRTGHAISKVCFFTATPLLCFISITGGESIGCTSVGAVNHD